MEMIIGSNENGLFIQYVAKINKIVIKRKIKEKTYTSTQYNITIPEPLIKFINTDTIFIKQISQTKYTLLQHEENDTISLTFRKSRTTSKSKKYVRHLLTLPKKFFNFLDDDYNDETNINIFCYVKNNKIHIDLTL